MLAIVFSPIVGRLVGKVDPRILICGGLTYLSSVFWMRTGFDTDIDFWRLALPQIAVGLGIPFFFIPLMALGTGGLPPDEMSGRIVSVYERSTRAGPTACTSWTR